MEPLFRPYDPDKRYLLPPSLRDWLPAGHLAYFISDTVDEMDLSAFLDRYRQSSPGNVAYHPALLCKLLLYGYATGVYSSRKLAAACETDIAFRLLAAGDAPSHRTLARFRKEHLEAFGGLVLQVVRIAQDAGLVKLHTLAIDGSKVRANASRHKAMTYKRMKREDKRLKKEIDEILRRADGIDAAEDVEFGEEFRGDELPEELRRRQDRHRVIRAAIKRLEERKKEKDAEKLEAEERRKAEGRPKARPKRKYPLGKSKPKDQENFTDPDSRIMNTKKDGIQQRYNAQIAVENGSQIIVAAGVEQNAADSGSLLPMLDEAFRIAGAYPTNVLADAGYKSESNYKGLEERQVTGYVALGREGKKPAKSPAAGLKATERMKQRMATKTGKKRYRRRKHIAEAPFGWIKGANNFRRFSLRGRKNVIGEWLLVCAAMNLRRMGTNWAWS